jgi:hypothetical protein
LVEPPGGAWSRGAIRAWIEAQAAAPLLLGFDFSFAPPFAERRAYLPGEATPTTARAFWAYVDAHCPDADLGAASFLESRRGTHFYLGAADGVKAHFLHFRRCEARHNALGGGKPSTVYDAIGAAQVAKASFAGMRLLHHLGSAVPVWPFDAVPASPRKVRRSSRSTPRSPPAPPVCARVSAKCVTRPRWIARLPLSGRARILDSAAIPITRPMRSLPRRGCAPMLRVPTCGTRPH